MGDRSRMTSVEKFAAGLKLIGALSGFGAASEFGFSGLRQDVQQLTASTKRLKTPAFSES